MRPLKHLKIGHFSNSKDKTGLTVLLFDKAVRCGAWICGSAPGLSSVVPFCQAGFSVNSIHSLLFTGGSALGLGASQGVVEWQHQQGIGLDVGVTTIPIVPAACIYDLSYGEVAWPNATQAKEACEQASTDEIVCGQVGVGTGATVGKLLANASPMPGGFGVAEIVVDDVIVQVYVAVNAVGDIRDQSGEIKAGATKDKQFVDSTQQVIAGYKKKSSFQTGIMNTTLVAVVTNAKFPKDALIRIAKMAAGGFAQAITPAFTALDGDIIFAISTEEVEADECVVGTMAAEAVRAGILRAVSS